MLPFAVLALKTIKNMDQKIGWRAAFTKYILYFALRVILWMFKMVPDHFVLVTSFGC
jgi:hypothetical protein